MENIPITDTETYMFHGRPFYPSSANIWQSPPITANNIDSD